MRRALTALAGVVLLLAGCSGDQPEAPTEVDNTTETVESEAANAILAEYGLDGMATRDLIDHLDRLPGPQRPSEILASVRAETLMVSDGQVETHRPIDGDEFYVSFAPYIDHTHDCFYHSLTTCQGELANVEMDVSIVGDDGEVYVDGVMETFDNGFLGVWLPTDITATLHVEYDGLSLTEQVSTDAEAPTCVTTGQLA